MMKRDAECEKQLEQEGFACVLPAISRD